MELGALKVEEREAWAQYLAATHDQSELRYEEVEPWAWKRLSQRLSRIRARMVDLGGEAKP